ncbi:A-kinase anchor protein 17A isoform X2 [Alosa sapidissima]|uniref:A-kinase anchor protein 17A isoform X2 n=1 Tax=Alosa sapidissima TaxID=34773 RepID=UPI001C082B5B|nr:A-kinase anchor protein 17A isoform X2 [Alosa sapidissima]
MTTIVHDTTEAVKLSQAHNLYLKPIAKMTINVGLPQLKLPGKSISNWEVMERLKAMVHPDQFSSLRISKSTMDFIRFEGEVENKIVVKSLLTKLDGKSIKLSGFTDILKVRAAENKVDFPTRHDWDSFFRDAKDMNETVPGERPDTIHLEGLPCKWFAQKDASPDKPSESVLKAVFEGFGKIRNVDIPMLDPYREEMTDKNFNTFTFGGHLNFEAYVQFQEYIGFVKAMDTLRGMKLMFKGEDGKAVACNVKVAFDTTKHLSESAVKRRQQERLKLQELERQREEQKRREKEEEERRKEEERKQREQEEEEKERRKVEKLRRREQKLREREEKRNQKKMKRQQEEEQRKLQLKIATEERKLLLAQRNLESIRLVAELLSRVKSLRQQQLEQEREEQAQQQKAEVARLQQLEERRRQQEAELRRVESEKARALELQRKERELRDRLLGNLLKKSTATTRQPDQEEGEEEEEEEGGLGLELFVRDPVLGVQLECQTFQAGAQVNGVCHGAGRPLGEGLSRQRKGERGDRAEQGDRHAERSRGRGGDGDRDRERTRNLHSSRRRSRSMRRRSLERSRAPRRGGGGGGSRRSPDGRGRDGDGSGGRRRRSRRRSESRHRRSHSRSRGRRSRRSWSSSGRSSRSSSGGTSRSRGTRRRRGRSLSRSSSSSRERRDHRHHSRSSDRNHSRRR